MRTLYNCGWLQMESWTVGKIVGPTGSNMAQLTSFTIISLRLQLRRTTKTVENMIVSILPVWAYNLPRTVRNWTMTLGSVKRTPPGPNSPPCWVLQQCSVELADPVCDILNLSFSTALPVQLLTSIVTPVPKVPQPKTINAFRLIPIISQLADKLSVWCWVRHSIKASDICDQFAFRPTGNTTTSMTTTLTFCSQHVTRLLKNN